MTTSEPPGELPAYDRIERRIQRAGHRYRVSDGGRAAALTELKNAISEADGHFSAQRAAELTGLPVNLLRAIQPDLTDGARP